MEARAEGGWVAPSVAAEHPGLAIHSIEVECRPGRSPAAVGDRLREAADRFYGAQAVHMRERPIPWAYRVFFRHVGLDPDRTRTPVEQLALERLRDGGFKSHGLPADALTIATIETGVALRCFDAARLAGRLGIRESAPGESLPDRPELTQGTLVIADERHPVDLLVGPGASKAEITNDTGRLALVAIQVEGVPDIAVDEAIWIVTSTLSK